LRTRARVRARARARERDRARAAHLEDVGACLVVLDVDGTLGGDGQRALLRELLELEAQPLQLGLGRAPLG